MGKYLLDSLELIKKPEYLALIISIIVICINVYISRKNRKHALEKEIYFKYQKIAEKIIAKLLILENQREKFILWIENSYKAMTEPKTIFLDNNEAFDKSDFEKNSDEIAALIQIYFPWLWGIRSECLTQMWKMLSIIVILKTKIERKENIEWEKAINQFNLESTELWNKPKEISDQIINAIKKFKEEKME